MSKLLQILFHSHKTTKKRKKGGAINFLALEEALNKDKNNLNVHLTMWRLLF